MKPTAQHAGAYVLSKRTYTFVLFEIQIPHSEKIKNFYWFLEEFVYMILLFNWNLWVNIQFFKDLLEVGYFSWIIWEKIKIYLDFVIMFEIIPDVIMNWMFVILISKNNFKDLDEKVLCLKCCINKNWFCQIFGWNILDTK